MCQYITEIRLVHGEEKGYPFDIPAVASLDRLSFTAPVTFFVGENGSGKSTLLEAISVAWGFNPEGGSKNMSFGTYESHSALHERLKLVKGPYLPKDGYFLRSESFYNVASHIEELDAVPAFAAPIKEAYGGSLHERSHGEAFSALFFKRIRGRGLYILDEPEAALSPNSQLAALVRIKELADAGSQFIIATHSPILASCPEAELLRFDEKGITPVKYEDTDLYRVYKYFMNNRERVFDELGINGKRR